MSAALLLGFFTLQRLVELRIARRNTQNLIVRGAYEVGEGHYPVMVALHAVWLGTLWIFAWPRALVPIFLPALFAVEVGRFWVLRTLGPRWTTRILVLPGAELVAGGPYRFLRHPNYAVVALELPLVSLALGLPWHALAFGILNLLMLRRRISVENAALKL